MEFMMGCQLLERPSLLNNTNPKQQYLSDNTVNRREKNRERSRTENYSLKDTPQVSVRTANCKRRTL